MDDTPNTIAEHAANASNALREALGEPLDQLLAPDLYTIIGYATPITYQYAQLLEHLADQLDTRRELGGLRDDRGHQPAGTATDAAAALRYAAGIIRTTTETLDEAHNLASHLGDNPELGGTQP